MNLIFLAPLALLGLLGLSIPIYLHMRHKPRAIPFRFSALEFLLRAQKKKQRRRKVEQIVLMILRLALLASVALLFARPFRESKQFMKIEGGPYLFILDDSASMLVEDDGQTLFQKAKWDIRDLLERLSSDHPAMLFLASNPSGQPSLKTAGDVLKMLPKLKPTTYHATLDNAYQAAMEQVRRDHLQQARIELVSDFMTTSWQQSPTDPEPGVQVHINSVGTDNQNKGLTSIRPIRDRGDQPGFEIGIYHSTKDRQTTELTLRYGQKTWKESIPLTAAATTTHQFYLDRNRQEPAASQISFELPDDPFKLDNRQTLPVQTYSTPRILVVNGDPKPIPEDNESYFLEFVLKGLAPDSVQIIAPGSIRDDRLEWADIIMLLNVDQPQQEVLSKALAMGKGVLITGGNRIQPEKWNPFLGNYGVEFWEWTELQTPLPLATPAFDSYAQTDMKASDFGLYFGEARFNKTQITTQNTGQMKPFYNLDDGSPLLLGGDLKPGRLLVYCSSLDLAGSNLPLQPGFVPFVQDMIDYLYFKEQQVDLQYMSISQMLQKGKDHFSLRENWTDMDPSSVNGPLPGLYLWTDNGQSKQAAIELDREERDFTPLSEPESQAQAQAVTMPESFKKMNRKDLGRKVAWILFFLILAETLVATRMSEKWGAR